MICQGGGKHKGDPHSLREGKGGWEEGLWEGQTRREDSDQDVKWIRIINTLLSHINGVEQQLFPHMHMMDTDEIYLLPDSELLSRFPPTKSPGVKSQVNLAQNLQNETFSSVFHLFWSELYTNETRACFGHTYFPHCYVLTTFNYPKFC